MPPRESVNLEMPVAQHFQAAFASTPVPMWITDPDQRCEAVNDALCGLLEQPREQLLGGPQADFFHPDERAVEADEFKRVLSGEHERLVRESRLVRADGSAIWVALAIACLRGPDGNVTGLVGQAHDITARRQHEQRLRHLAEHDPLTGLLNRRGFDRELRVHVSRNQRYDPRGALLMLDLDGFKGYNDAHGHAAGDKLLRSIGTVLSGRLRGGDVIGRIGGDEFAALLPEATPEQAEVVAQALTLAVRDSEHDGRHVTVSIGLFNFSAVTPSSNAGAMVNADSAMYAAKHNGRDRYARFSGESLPPAGKTHTPTPVGEFA